jgi:hypothetical protein
VGTDARQGAVAARVVESVMGTAFSRVNKKDRDEVELS